MGDISQRGYRFSANSLMGGRLKEQPKGVVSQKHKPIRFGWLGKLYDNARSRIYADLRDRMGKDKYGVYLGPFNGRDSLRDLVDELYDSSVYAAVLFEETRKYRYVILSYVLFKLVNTLYSDDFVEIVELKEEDPWLTSKNEEITNDRRN